MNPARLFVARFRNFIHGCVNSRLGWLLASVHASWFFLAIANMAPPNRAFAQFLEGVQWSSSTLFAGRPFHFVYESMYLRLLFLVDLPAMLAQLPLIAVLYPLHAVVHPSLRTRSYISAALLLVFATGQWMAMGYWIESRNARRLPQPRWLVLVNRFFFWLMSFVILFTAITVPIVNARSRVVGSRHSGISCR